MTAHAPDSAGAQGEGDIAELLLPPSLTGSVEPLTGGRALDLAGETMGTRWSLSAVVPVGFDPTRVTGALESAFALVIGQMSQWDPESELSRFNRAPTGSRFELSREFALVLDCALGVARASGGAFDPTLGAASELWGFGAGPATRGPGSSRIRVPGAGRGRRSSRKRLCWRRVSRPRVSRRSAHESARCTRARVRPT